MACSAVVIELPKGGVHDDDAARRGGGHVDVVDADAGAADHLEVLGVGEQLLGDLGGRADGEAVVVADDFGQLFLVLAEIGLVVDLDAVVLEDLDGGGGQLVGNENARSHGNHPGWMAPAPCPFPFLGDAERDRWRRMECHCG